MKRTTTGLFNDDGIEQHTAEQGSRRKSWGVNICDTSEHERDKTKLQAPPDVSQNPPLHPLKLGTLLVS